MCIGPINLIIYITGLLPTRCAWNMACCQYVLPVSTEWQPRGDTHDQFMVRLKLDSRHTQEFACVTADSVRLQHHVQLFSVRRIE